MSVIGERSNSTSSSNGRMTLVDVEEGHVAAEAAGQRHRGDLQLARLHVRALGFAAHHPASFSLSASFSTAFWLIGLAS